MKQNRKIVFAFCLLAFLLITPTGAQTTKLKPKPTETYKIAREGVGLEGITVGKSTVADVEKKFGKNYKWTAHKKYSYSMAYPKLGLTFYICQTDKRREIFDIEIRQPYRAKTSKGIVLGKSTVEDIYKIYGKSKDGLEYRGVSFFYANFAGKKTVTVIDIVENSGIRQCKEAK
jgi:hypothetical protein